MTSIQHEFNPNMTAVAQAIAAFTNLPEDADAASLHKQAGEIVAVFTEQCTQLAQAIKLSADTLTFPSVREELWVDGGVLGALAQMLATKLRQRGLIDLEEQAHSLCCVMVLALQSRYPHTVGPVIIGQADCYERQHGNERAIERYQAVVTTFRVRVETWVKQSASPTTAERISLQCLAYALERLLALLPDDATATLLPLQRQCRQVLDREPTLDPPIGDDNVDRVRIMRYHEGLLKPLAPSDRFALYAMLTLRPIWMAVLLRHCLPSLQDNAKELQREFPQFAIDFWVGGEGGEFEIACYVGSSKAVEAMANSIGNKCIMADHSIMLGISLDWPEHPFIEVAAVYWVSREIEDANAPMKELAGIPTPLLCSSKNLQVFAAELPRLMAALHSVLQHIAHLPK